MHARYVLNTAMCNQCFDKQVSKTIYVAQFKTDHIDTLHCVVEQLTKVNA